VDATMSARRTAVLELAVVLGAIVVLYVGTP
jgi:hypothetical protein